MEADTIKQVEMKEKIQKKYLRRTRKQLKTKLSSRNLIKGIDTCAVTLVRYPGAFVKGTGELKLMEQRTRKLITMHEASHHRDYVDRLYVSRKEVGGGLASIEDGVDASIQQLKDYIERFKGRLITTLKTDTDHTVTNIITITRKQKWEEKQLYRRFKRIINDISHEKTWTWLRKENFKRETESLQIATQNSAIRTNQIKARIDKT